MACACNPILVLWRVLVSEESLPVQGQPGVYIKFQDTLGYIVHSGKLSQSQKPTNQRQPMEKAKENPLAFTSVCHSGTV